MAFVFEDHQLCFNTKRFQGVPEFVGLRRGTFAVAVANDDQGGSLHVLDKIDRRAFRVDLGIIVDRLAKERNHPLVDFIFAVVAEPIGDAGAGHGGFEAVGLRDSPHGHEAAVAPAGKAEAVRVDGSDAQGLVDAGEDVAKISVAEIPDVGARKGFALAIAAARIGLKNKVTGAREGHHEVPRVRPFRLHRGPRTAVNCHDHGVFFRGIEIAGIDEPALHVVAIVFPVDAFGFAPSGFYFGVAMRDWPPVADGAGPDFRRVTERAADDGGRFSIARERNVGAPEARGNLLLAAPERIDRTTVGIDHGHPRVAFDGFPKDDFSLARPSKPVCRRWHFRRDVLGFASGRGNRVDITADGRLIAHQASDESDSLAVRRPCRIRHLERRLVNRLHQAGRSGVEKVKVGDVPVVVAVAGRSDHRETRTVWRPIVFVDVHVGGRDLPEVAGRQVNESEALFEKGVFYFAGLGSFRYQWAGRACGVFGRKQGDGLAIGRPARRGQEALGAGQLLGRATRSAHHIQLELAGFHGIGEERHLPAVR